MVIKLDTPGRNSGSNVSGPSMESVVAFMIFVRIELASSVIRILVSGSGSDLDIFLAGSLRLRILLVGAIRVRGSVKKLDLVCLLNTAARSLVNSRCWTWS
ncbi:hypothetical protein OGAPHI_001682 [Ogataea philodendri]|uniref:Uncharacterized protein n=1 Tax=Ogataea philodendri TaxID=1378263 RepID=A0A9P8PC49_9ASCO|nr:uncharacterized protein OGAPHI_001682 [Ogataea philodendri]KAH3669086.1 hypothetical protein OGAPHI_001682 [Ogataea philodendri]